MAISFQTNKLSDHALLDKLLASNLAKEVVKYNPDIIWGHKFLTIKFTKDKLVSVEVPKNFCSELLQGKIPLGLPTVGGKLTMELKALNFNDLAMDAVTATIDVAEKVAQIAEQYNASPETVQKIKNGGWGESSDLTTPPVLLSEATKLYQPVRGTSSGSIYFVVALGEDVKVAARMSKSKMSVRVESSDKKLLKDLVDYGYTSGNVDSGYVSIHLTPNNDETVATKTLMSLLGGLVGRIETPLPNTKRIMGKGN